MQDYRIGGGEVSQLTSVMTAHTLYLTRFHDVMPSELKECTQSPPEFLISISRVRHNICGVGGRENPLWSYSPPPKKSGPRDYSLFTTIVCWVFSVRYVNCGTIWPQSLCKVCSRSNRNINDVLGDYCLTLVDTLDTLAVSEGLGGVQIALEKVYKTLQNDLLATNFVTGWKSLTICMDVSTCL